MIPKDYDQEVLKVDQYAFTIKDVVTITAKNYGNWTRYVFFHPPSLKFLELISQPMYRFMRHSCFSYNVWTKREMYGKGIVITFIARIDIRHGDQLFINYGRNYFESLNKQCDCEWSNKKHLPPTDQELTDSGRVSPPMPVLVDTLANMRLTWSLLNANHFPQVRADQPNKFKETRTFDIDINAGGFVTTREFTIPRSALGNANGTGSKTIDIDLILRRRTGGNAGAKKTPKKT